MTFWININDFTDRFMGSLTALLVLASLMSTLTESLPKTSYYKVIDFWLLFFLLSTSLNIAVHVLVDRFYQAELRLKDTKKIVDKWSQNTWGSGETQITPVSVAISERIPSPNKDGKKESSHQYIPRAAAQG